MGDGRGNWTGPAYPPSDMMPGTGFPDAPPNAPNDRQDTFTQADKRLEGMWPEQQYYGAKPGQQTDSTAVDDIRDTRQPLPACDWCKAHQHAVDVEGSGFFAGPPPPGHRLPGPSPMMPNPTSETEMMGITTSSFIDDIELGPYYIDEDNPYGLSEEEIAEARRKVENLYWSPNGRIGTVHSQAYSRIKKRETKQLTVHARAVAVFAIFLRNIITCSPGRREEHGVPVIAHLRFLAF